MAQWFIVSTEGKGLGSIPGRIPAFLFPFLVSYLSFLGNPDKPVGLLDSVGRNGENDLPPGPPRHLRIKQTKEPPLGLYLTWKQPIRVSGKTSMVALYH